MTPEFITRRRAHAREATEVLEDIFGLLETQGTARGLQTLAVGHRTDITRLFVEDPGLGSRVLAYHRQLAEAFRGVEGLDEVPILLSSATLLTLLLELLPSRCGHEAPQMAYGLQQAIDALIRRWLARIKPQCDALLAALATTAATVAANAAHADDIILLELPIGNSLATALLSSALSQLGVAPHVRQLSAPRNERPSRGRTRAQHIAEQLGGALPERATLAVYVDEWSTGTNFAAINEALRDALPAHVRLLPVALLQADSATHPRHASFVARHDRLLAAVGVGGVTGRFVLPPLGGEIQSTHYFFWSEHDRLAGYRKMQITGSLFGNVTAAIKLLLADPSLLESVRAEIAERVPGDAESSALVEAARDTASFARAFEDSAERFLAAGAALAGPGVAERAELEIDFIDQISDAGDRLAHAARTAGAGLAFGVAICHDRSRAIVDVRDRDALEHEPREFVRLTEAPAYLHQTVLGALADLLGLELARRS